MNHDFTQDYLERLYWQCINDAQRASDVSVATGHRTLAQRYARALEEDCGLIIEPKCPVQINERQ